MLVLPDDIRKKLQEPIGQLVDEHDLLAVLQSEQFIVTVGDLVTYTLLKNALYPKICIVDFIVERKPYSSEMKETIKEFGVIHVHVKNPQGVITDELWDALESSFHMIEKGPICIEVEGEEDLASLAAIYLAPPDATIIYGLPNKGVVIVKATEAHKKKVKEVLDKM
jgi:hypothetical protein